MSRWSSMRKNKSKKGKCCKGGSKKAVAQSAGGSCSKKGNTVSQSAGGSCSKKGNTVAQSAGGSCSKKENDVVQKAGSLASSFVEEYANAQPQQLDDYETALDLPAKEKITGGGCGCGMMKGGKRKRKSNGKSSRKMKGGSSASNSVLSAVAEPKLDTMDYVPSAPVTGVESQPNLYELTGGQCKSKKNRQTGAGFANMSGYGNINAGPNMFKNDHHFVKKPSHPSWSDLMDPPSKGKAGSGDSAGDLTVGASYPFK